MKRPALLPDLQQLVFAETGAEIELRLGAMDAPDLFRPGLRKLDHPPRKLAAGLSSGAAS